MFFSSITVMNFISWRKNKMCTIIPVVLLEPFLIGCCRKHIVIFFIWTLHTLTHSASGLPTDWRHCYTNTRWESRGCSHPDCQKLPLQDPQCGIRWVFVCRCVCTCRFTVHGLHIYICCSSLCFFLNDDVLIILCVFLCVCVLPHPASGLRKRTSQNQ